MADRYFTLDEATATLRELRPVAERMVELHQALEDAATRRATLRETVAGNGGGLVPTEIAEADAEVEQLRAALGAAVAKIQSEGVEVKDLGLGLLDFPALRDDDEILLCWHVGEDEIRFWHGRDEGFAGRKPLDEVE